MSTAKELYELSCPAEAVLEDGTTEKRFKTWEQLGQREMDLWVKWSKRCVNVTPSIPGQMTSGSYQVDTCHAEALVRLGFILGMDSAWALDSQLVEQDWGGPPVSLLAAPDFGLVIKCEAKGHKHFDPVYTKTHLICSLGFDKVYRVKIPWEAFKRIMFYPEAPEPESVA